MGRFIDRCHFSPTGWAWWKPHGDSSRCTCKPAPASVDTHPKGEDAKQASALLSSAAAKQDAQPHS